MNEKTSPGHPGRHPRENPEGTPVKGDSKSSERPLQDPFATPFQEGGRSHRQAEGSPSKKEASTSSGGAARDLPDVDALFSNPFGPTSGGPSSSSPGRGSPSSPSASTAAPDRPQGRPSRMPPHPQSGASPAPRRAPQHPSPGTSRSRKQTPPDTPGETPFSLREGSRLPPAPSAGPPQAARPDGHRVPAGDGIAAVRFRHHVQGAAVRAGEPVQARRHSYNQDVQGRPLVERS